MLLDQNAAVAPSSASPPDSSSPASTLIRGNSEPPGENSYNETNGLRRSRNPIKVSGITMGSQENLAGNDELSSVFARRRRRRSATPVKIGGIVMGDGLEEDYNTCDAAATNAPFGVQNKRNSYHPGMNRKNSSVGMWGQRFFTNGDSGHSSDYDTNSFQVKKDTTDTVAGISDVKQFLTDMQKEITALTNNVKDEVTDKQILESNLKTKKTEMTESISTTTAKDQVFENEMYSQELNSESYKTTMDTRVMQTTEYKSSVQEQKSESHITSMVKTPDKDELPRLENVANVHLDTCNSVSVEETIIINPNAIKDSDEEIIEIEPEMVKYHSGQTPHPNRFDPSKAFQVMSEAEDNDDEIIEVDPSDVHIHDGTIKTGLLVPPSPARSLSKSPSPHLAILSDFITKKMDREKTPIIVQETVQVENVMTSTVQESSFQLETAVVSTVQVEVEEHSSVIHEEEEKQAAEMEKQDDLFVIDKQESKAMEDLFDKLVAEESVKINKVEKSQSFDAIKNWIMKSESHFETSKAESNNTTVEEIESRVDKLKNKRNRNKTMDFSTLDNNWYEATAICSSKTFTPQEPIKQDKPKLAVQTSLSTTETDSSESTPGIADKTKPGLCLIIDKLKSIETKLDELKTLDNSERPLSPEAPLFLLPEVNPAPTQPENKEMEDFKILKAEETVIPTTNAIDDDDDTLKDDEDNDSQATDISHTTELLVDDANIVVSSPAPTPRPDDKLKLRNKNLSHIDIMSVHTMSEVDADDEEDEEDEEDISSGRQSRIEELAKKIMEEEAKLASIERTRHSSNPVIRDPINLNAELDTVSERSEMEEEPADKTNDPKSGRRSADHLQQQPPEKGSFRNRRTRSASRERNLAKIRFCWRCHQTGHESFDCTAELQPANWCPRCLETSHWEDNCWVNEQEVFCNICTLPGHLPCVHQTNDFRQRKLVIETFGWLAFKDWFREPEFWSWWNCSGFTNVPLYKLMQHRPHVASPTDLQEITE